MSEIALYRKYRSDDFKGVIGQDHIITALKGAVNAGRVSHAYLFTGPRGVGKTTVARVLAKSVNCTGTGEAPCKKCQNCLAGSTHLDIIEIDAASHRGIDDARSLREKIGLAPAMGKYKVYIIDEVHMLTTEAFNALLKTIEEPPSHAIFILATTESHKLPDTIISRTQRFQFQPITVTDMVKQLLYIAKREEIGLDKNAAALLAEASNGGFRDAISLLDQLAAGTGNQIDYETIRRMLGWSSQDLIEGIVGAVLARQPAKALALIDDCLSQGAQPQQLTLQLMRFCREAIRKALSVNPPEASLSEYVKLFEALIIASRQPLPDLALEAAVVRLALGETTFVTPQAHPATAKPQPPAVPKPEAAKPQALPKQQVEDKDLWMKALAQIKQRNNSLYALLGSSCTVTFDNNNVILGCRFGFHRDRLKEQKNMLIIETALARVYGRKLLVQVQVEASPRVAQTDQSNELVASALEILGGEVAHD
ncbi:MAG TPA: DNA polymerase III subunit gamma/tau [Candidatus Dormibacteraeota bacterium]|nr:DNA polymerase III subunit gamma/tau [Candidatus Dormibacteraeota bacterium]